MLQAMRQFPSELQAMDKAGLKEHLKEHPRCQFCNAYFFGVDELYDHMRTQHFWCYVCAGMGRHVYFPTSIALLDHLG